MQAFDPSRLTVPPAPAEAAAAVAAVLAEAPAPMPVPQPSTRAEAATAPVAAVPGPSSLAARHMPALKSQQTSVDARTERLFRQVKTEVDDLRTQLDLRRDSNDRLTELDVEAVASDPEAASALSPAVLVKALLELRDENAQLQGQLGRSKKRVNRLRGRVQQLKQQREYTRGRLETLDQVVEALHGNLQDLRAHRDAVRVLGSDVAEAPLLEQAPEAALPPAEDE